MKIAIATGGSGGHIFPALGVAKELKKQNHEIMFLVTRGIAEEKVRQYGFTLSSHSARGLSFKSPLAYLRSIFYMSKAVCESYGALRRFRPDIVAGFGGYGAFPSVFVASLLRYPTLIHEQNVIPGRANNILKIMVNRIAISFERSRKHFNQKKTVLTGCPAHYQKSVLSRSEILREFNLLADVPVILVLGGSQGSHRVNEEFFHAALELRKFMGFQVIHIAGHQDFQHIRSRYKDAGITCFVCEFLDEIEKAYTIADCVVSRAGAATICELAMFRVPAIVIPYPFAGGHQRENVQILYDIHLAEIIEEENLKGHVLCTRLKEILATDRKAESATISTHNICFPDATGRIAKAITELKDEK